jgi:hypothetical protein
MPDALPDATLPISRLGTGSTNGSNNGRGWGLTAHRHIKGYSVPLMLKIPTLDIKKLGKNEEYTK